MSRGHGLRGAGAGCVPGRSCFSCSVWGSRVQLSWAGHSHAGAVPQSILLSHPTESLISFLVFSLLIKPLDIVPFGCD